MLKFIRSKKGLLMKEAFFTAYKFRSLIVALTYNQYTNSKKV